MTKPLFATLALLGASVATVRADVVSIASPSGTTEIGARIRWGASGFEASLFDNNPFGQTPTLNPVGSPVWAVGQAYKFQVGFNSGTGDLSLYVDFNRDNSFGAGESITRNLFAAPGQLDYTGYGFNYLSISGNEGGSTGRSTVSNLVINGDAQSSISPNGAFLENFYDRSSGNLFTSVTITGDLTFTTAGTAQERPSWNFNFQNSAIPSVPDGGATLVLLGSALMGIAAIRRKLGA